MKTFVEFSPSEKTIFPKNLGWILRNLRYVNKFILNDCSCSSCIRVKGTHAFSFYAFGRMPRGKRGSVEHFRFGCSFASEEAFDSLLRSRLSRYAEIVDERRTEAEGQRCLATFQNDEERCEKPASHIHDPEDGLHVSKGANWAEEDAFAHWVEQEPAHEE